MDTGVEKAKELPQIVTTTDTRDILARSRQFADDNKLDDWHIIDVDAHHSEGGAWWEIISYLEDPVLRQMAESFKDRPGSPMGLSNAGGGMNYQDVYGRIPHQQGLAELVEEKDVHRDVTLARRVMSAMSIDQMVIFPTPLLLLGMHPQEDVQSALALAYNRWAQEHLLEADDTLVSLVYLPFQDPEACERIVKEFTGKKGVIGFCITSVRNAAVHHNKYMKLYRMIEETGLPLSFHAGYNWEDGSIATTNRFISMHALSFVHCNIVHMTNWIINGLPERFPNLKVLWIESGLAWVPYLMQRLDNEYLMRTSEAPLLKRRPSEYMREMFYTNQPMEITDMKLTEATFEAINAETQLLYASDWPHWDFDTPASVLDLPFLDEQAKRNIMGLNSAKLFNLKQPTQKARDKVDWSF